MTLDFAHAHGIVHRALEPGAIRLGEFGEVYVVGWDRARAPIIEGSPISEGTDSAARPAVAAFSGIRDPWAVIAVATGWAFAAAVLYLQGTRILAARLPWSAIAGLSAVGLTSLVLGPNILVPSAAVAMTLGYILGGRAEWRRLIVVLGCASVVVPGLLTWLGVPHVYDLGSTTPVGTFVLNGALFHPPGKLLPGLIIGNVAAVLVASAYAVRFRHMLEKLEADNRAKAVALTRLVS